MSESNHIPSVLFFKIRSILSDEDCSNYYKPLTPIELENILSQITLCIKCIFDLNSELNLINKKAIKRLETIDFDKDDKVPPGSNNVTRSYNDNRFVLCSLCIFQSQVSRTIYACIRHVVCSLSRDK